LLGKFFNSLLKIEQKLERRPEVGRREEEAPGVLPMVSSFKERKKLREWSEVHHMTKFALE